MSFSLYPNSPLVVPDRLRATKKAKKEADFFSEPLTLQNEYEELTREQTIDEDIENVKGLDFWHLTDSRRNHGFFEPSFVDSKVAKEFKQKKSQEGIGFPTIKADLLNRILANNDEVLAAPVMQTEPNNEEDNFRLPLIKSESGKPFKRYEATKLAHNEELIHELVLKKMKEQINVDIISRMGQSQIRLYIRAIAEEAVAHFKSLKGLLSPKLIQNYVNAALEMVRESKKGPESAFKPKEIKDWTTEDKPALSYEATERNLITELDYHTKEAKELRTLVAEIGHKLFNGKKERAIYQDKLKHLQKEYQEIMRASDPNLQTNGKYVQRRIAVNSPKLVKDHMTIKKLKDENKHEEAQAMSALAEIEDKLSKLEIELSQSEKALKASKNKKAYCKMQLKKLYYDILRDEDALMRGNDNYSSKSYAWVIRALWSLGEEVKEDAFPSFLDAKTTEFFVTYAKFQEELELYCRSNNMFSLLNNLKSFKPLENILHYRNEYKNANKKLPDSTPNEPVGSMPELEADMTKIAAKSLNMLMNEFQEKAFELKKANLKAKRPVEVCKYVAKDKNLPVKWEEVDLREFTVDKLPTNRANSFFYSNAERKASLLRAASMAKPLEKAMNILDRLDQMKKECIERLTKSSMAKPLDERAKLELHKIFRFLFGKDEGDLFYFKLITDKKFIEEKIGATIKKIKTKTGPSDILMPIKYSKSAGEGRSQSSINCRKVSDFPSSTKNKAILLV